MRTRRTLVLPAGRVDAGDIVVGPDLSWPARIGWRCTLTRPGMVRLELTGGRRLLVDRDEPLLVVARPPAGDPDWWRRCVTALAGAAAERALLSGGPDDMTGRRLRAHVDAAAVRWAGLLAALTGEDPQTILARYR